MYVREFAWWLEGIKQTKRAIPLLENYAKRHPRDHKIAAQLAWCLVDSDINIKKSHDLIQFAISQSPDDPYLKDTLAWVQYKQGELRKARETITPILPVSESAPIIAYHAAAIQFRLGAHRQSVELLSRALANKSYFSGREHAEALFRRLTKRP